MCKMYNKTIIEFGFRMIMNYQNLVSVLSAEAETADNTDLGFDNS